MVLVIVSSIRDKGVFSGDGDIIITRNTKISPVEIIKETMANGKTISKSKNEIPLEVVSPSKQKTTISNLRAEYIAKKKSDANLDNSNKLINDNVGMTKEVQ
jgi:molybdopterin converting factor small subunit